MGATTATTTEAVSSTFLFEEAIAFRDAIFMGSSKDHAISKLQHAMTMSLHEEVLFAAALENRTTTIMKLAEQIVNQRPMGKFFVFDCGKKQMTRLKEISHEEAIKIIFNLIQKYKFYPSRRANAEAALIEAAEVVAMKEAIDDGLCVSCMDAKKKIVFLPCTHLCLCKNCAITWESMGRDDCIMCREKIETTMEVIW